MEILCWSKEVSFHPVLFNFNNKPRISEQNEATTSEYTCFMCSVLFCCCLFALILLGTLPARRFLSITNSPLM